MKDIMLKESARVVKGIVGAVVLVAIVLAAFFLAPSQVLARRNSQATVNIVNGFHDVTRISVEYNSDIHWFYGSSLEYAKNQLNPLYGGFTKLDTQDVAFADDTVSARVRFYVEDNLLFSAIIADWPRHIRGGFMVTTTDGSRWSALFIDDTTLIGAQGRRALNLAELLYFATQPVANLHR
jgi:hypothetical protein